MYLFGCVYCQTHLALDATGKDNEMSQSASQYPISKVIDRIMNDSGLRRSQFVQSLGYRSVQGGLRRLDEWLQEGHGDSGILEPDFGGLPR